MQLITTLLPAVLLAGFALLLTYAVMKQNQENGQNEQDGAETGDTYTVAEVSKILKRTQPTVRRMLNNRVLLGTSEGGKWAVRQDSVHDYLTTLRAAGESPDTVADRTEELAIKLGQERARRELTEFTDSTLRSEIARLGTELEVERERRISAEIELSWYRKSVWQRVFGG